MACICDVVEVEKAACHHHPGEAPEWNPHEPRCHGAPRVQPPTHRRSTDGLAHLRPLAKHQFLYDCSHGNGPFGPYMRHPRPVHNQSHEAGVIARRGPTARTPFREKTKSVKSEQSTPPRPTSYDPDEPPPFSSRSSVVPPYRIGQAGSILRNRHLRRAGAFWAMSVGSLFDIALLAIALLKGLPWVIPFAALGLAASLVHIFVLIRRRPTRSSAVMEPVRSSSDGRTRAVICVFSTAARTRLT